MEGGASKYCWPVDGNYRLNGGSSSLIERAACLEQLTITVFKSDVLLE